MGAEHFAAIAVNSLLGFAGAAVGIYFALRSTKGPRERSFVIRAVAWGGAGVLLFLVLLVALILILPHPYKPLANLLWLIYIPVLIVAIVMWNRRQSQIREEESRGGDHDPLLKRPSNVH